MISLIDAQLAEHEQLFNWFYPLDDENTTNKEYNVHILKEKNFFKTLIRSKGTSTGLHNNIQRCCTCINPISETTIGSLDTAQKFY